MRLGVLCLCLAWCVFTEAHAECVRAPDPQVLVADADAFDPGAAAIGATRQDRLGRMVAPVMLNGQGPFRFVVDTGSNRSVVSHSVASRLGLTPSGFGVVHSVHGQTTAPLVDVATIRYGGLSLPAAPMPVLSGPILAGEHGLLGVDGMQGRRLRLDFDRECIEIRPATRSRFVGEGWTRVRGQLRFGHLIVIPARVGGVTVNVLIDTGSDRSLANPALRDALRRANPGFATDISTAVRAYGAGEAVLLDDAIALPRLSLQDLQVRNLVAYVGDFHIFSLWGLQDEPTMLIGMDVLLRAREIVIDYSRATIDFRVRRSSRTGSNIFRHQGRTSSTYE